MFSCFFVKSLNLFVKYGKILASTLKYGLEIPKKHQKLLHRLHKQINNNKLINFIYLSPAQAKTIYDLKSASLIKGKTHILTLKIIKFFITCEENSFIKTFLGLSPFHSVESLPLLKISGSLPIPYFLWLGML